jgi:hypothetical protein
MTPGGGIRRLLTGSKRQDEKMTEIQSPPAPPEFSSPKEAKAQAKAAKAYSKATRPWFKKKRIILPLALIVVIGISVAAKGGGDKGTSDSTTNASQPKAADAPKADAPKAAAPKAAAVPGIGAKVRDGKFEFVVTGVERPGKSFAGEFGTTETAQGEFVIVRVNVSNIGNEAQTLMSTGQVLFNNKGQKFEPSTAILSLKGADKFFLQNINPGNTVKGAPLLFDVAPGTKIASVELHDSPFSGGVKVKVS